MAKETAEQKLLKLIESTDAQSGSDSGASQQPSAPAAAAESKSSGASAAQAALQSVRAGGMPAVSIPSVGNFLSYFKQIELFSKSPAEYSLKDINKILVICIVVTGLFFFNSIVAGLKSAQQDMDFSRAQDVPGVAETALPTFQKVGDYVQVISQRNIFQPYEKKVVAKTEGPVENQQIRGKFEALRLVGISWLDSPDTATVMVEDQKTSITHFLREGESLQGVSVERIYADRVKFRMGEETVSVGL